MTPSMPKGWGSPAGFATLAIALLPLHGVPAAARDASGLVAAADGPALMVGAPKGWVIDERGTTDGIPLVLHPEDGSWDDSKAVMYVRTFPRNGKLSLERFVRDDVARFRARSPRGKVLERESIAIEGGARALVREFSNDRWGNRESVAYRSTPEGYVLAVLSARDAASHHAAEDAFHDLVRAIRPLKQGDDLFPVATALQGAERNAATRDGRGFDARIAGELRGTVVLKECASRRTDDDGVGFSLLMRLAADGSVEEVLARPGARVAECLRKSLLEARFSAPPRASYWVRVALDVTGPEPPAADLGGTASRSRPD
jgi:hypothetical protein